MSNTGIFGKLPSYGDFLSRDLDSNFVEVWDVWLQGFVQSTQEQLGESWLDVYLTSPIWRFALSRGVVDDSTWVGLVLPSVDRVGRYFPFSIASNVETAPPAVLMSSAVSWFDELEDIALQALEGETEIDDILESINTVVFPQDQTYHSQAAADGVMGAVINMEFDAQNVHSVYPQLLHHVLAQNQQSYSIWSTRGSQLVEPCVFYSRGLPPLGGAAAMLDGNWQASNWAQPFALATEISENTYEQTEHDIETHE